MTQESPNRECIALHNQPKLIIKLVSEDLALPIRDYGIGSMVALSLQSGVAFKSLCKEVNTLLTKGVAPRLLDYEMTRWLPNVI